MALDILIVDDELDIRELVAGVLEDEGYGARVAADSDSALEAVAARRPSSSCSTSGSRDPSSTGSNCSTRSSGEIRRFRCW